MLRIYRQVVLLAGFTLVALVTKLGLAHSGSPYASRLSLHRIWSSGPPIPPLLGFGLIFRTYVVSLAHRDDRKVDIDKLMNALHMPNWAYHNATYSHVPLIGNLMRKVQAQRMKAETEWGRGRPDSQWVTLPFEWSSDSFSDYTSNKSLWATPLPPAGAELWPDDPSHNADELKPLIGAYDDFRLQRYREGLIPWRYLTPARVATYHSHMSVLRKIVDDNAKLRVDVSQDPNRNRTQTHVSLILEDDVDIESDIEQRMKVILPLLPFNWDVLFLGFCWSNEARWDAIVGEYIRPSKNQLHPSNAPRCLHAYAVSPAGALKLLFHLRHEQFAYGRAVDEAFTWLVQSKRVNAFTTVPPLIIQRKVTKTDISIEGNDLWRESLDRGVLGTTLNGEEV